MRSRLLHPNSRPRSGAFGWAARAALFAIAVATVIGASATDAHPGHPQKKLFSGQWYQPAIMNLSTSQTWLECDGSPAACGSKWSTPAQDSLNDWNAQPTTVDFILQPDQDINYDINIFVEDSLGDPFLLGFAVWYNAGGSLCDPNACTYYYGEAYAGDNAHTGAYGTADERRGTIIHELGHLLNLRHESVNADESQQYACGFDDTGPIPHSVMAYNCIDPPPIGLAENYVHDWDTCGVNHKYYDPAFAYSECGYDEDNDGVDEPPDNCPGLYNPTQSNVDGDGSGDACDGDIDGDGIVNGSDVDADGDKVYNNDETNCGADALDGSRRPERIDGPFAGVNDDGDGQTDEALPPGAAPYDCDGDGFTGSTEASVFADGGNGDRDACGSNGWPAELANGDNSLNIGDMNSFLFPLRPDDGHGPFAYFNHPVPDPNIAGEARWNLDTAGGGAGLINIGDLNALNPAVNSPTSKPPMFGGQAAFFTNLGHCPWPP